MLRRVLTAKRVARLFLEGLGEASPGLEALDTAAMIEDLPEIAAESAEENADIDAAKAFAEHDPLTIEEWSTTGEEETFSSYDAFKKLDLEKRFGPAGDGYEYHHIVEQSADFSQEPAAIDIEHRAHPEAAARGDQFDLRTIGGGSSAETRSEDSRGV